MRKTKKKRKVKKTIKTILILFITLIILAGLSIIVLNFLDKSKTSNNIQQPKEKEKEEEKEQHYEATLVAVGDMLIHSSVYKDANKHAGYNGYDFKPMFNNIKDIIKEYDIAYYNQETILGGTELGLSDYPTFNSPYEAGNDMLEIGFNLVSLATNHTMDRGKAAVENSCKYWNSKENVLTAGSYCSEEERNKINIKTVNNISYTMLNYTYGTNGMPQINDYYVNVWPTNTSINNPENDTKYQEYKEQIKKDIENVRDKVDILIVAMHWGVEYTHTPTIYEKDMANYLASLGVDVIIGTHPHVIQPITWIDNTLVIYSLGNFISAQYQNQSTCTFYKCTVGLMTNFTIEKTTKGNTTTEIKITNLDNELIYNYYNQSSWRGFNIIPFSNPIISEYLPNYEKVYNTYKDVVQNLNKDIHVKELSN